MVITQERTQRQASLAPERGPAPSRATLWWTIFGVVAAVVVASGLWVLLGSTGEEALEPSAPPAVTAEHDSGIEQLLRERTTAAPSTHDSGIEQLLRERTTTAPSTHDSGIEQLLRERT
jgi:hypothetical protein